MGQKTLNYGTVGGTGFQHPAPRSTTATTTGLSAGLSAKQQQQLSHLEDSLGLVDVHKRFGFPRHGGRERSSESGVRLQVQRAELRPVGLTPSRASGASTTGDHRAGLLEVDAPSFFFLSW